MTKLYFDYCRNSNELIAYYGGDSDDAPYRVRMIQDNSPINPFENDFGHWPMIVDYQDRGHYFTTYDSTKGVDVERPFDRFTDGQIIKHQRAIIAAIGGRYYNTLTGEYSLTMAEQFAQDVKDYRESYDSMADCKRDLFEQALNAVSAADKLETLASLYEIIGIAALCTSSQGYSQGDYVELLIVATPEAQKEFGWKAKRSKAKMVSDMEAQAKLYGYWAWGDCYGYIVERRDSEDDWQEIDSCWGYYGPADESGLEESALDAIEHDIREHKRAHFNKLKELIRSRVPLAARAAVMAELPLIEESN